MTSDALSARTRVERALARIPPCQPVLAVVGPTASGKSEWGIRLARAFDGEVLSADSRQIYRGLDLGTGKVAGVPDLARARDVAGLGRPFTIAPWVSDDIDHWLIDIADPRDVVTLAEYQALAYDAIADVAARGRLPIVVGGTGLYVSAIFDGLVMPAVAPDPTLRAQLETMSTEALATELRRLDPQAGDVVDMRNPRRLVRAIEVARQTGSVAASRGKLAVPFRTLQIAPHVPRAELHGRIRRRLLERLDQGLVEEVERLAAAGVAHSRFEDLGLEYRFISRYLRGTCTRAEMVEALERAITKFARRQETWLRAHGPVQWLDTPDEALAAVRDWR